MSMQPTAGELIADGFAMGGERLVALDLVDTELLAVDPPVDLIGTPEQLARWWALQQVRLPAGPVPDGTAVRRLRTAVRELLGSHLEGREPSATSVDDVNAAAAGAPQSLRLAATTDGLRVATRWHPEYGGNAALAMIARETIELMADAAGLSRLRRCANPNCSMLFLAEHKRRQWCVGSVCGNRTRVARHYEKTRRS
ncbi:CGNR zinc finger domain-containing protein [Kribbella sp. CA-293567]|uniref:CGNR zinc finger domain-containing protein n=1 Tax=Kribbella sp. CA-293567 TaxID=3002436 RepID=UPI0022DE3661|nr:ABATE domain-containing protein [Kribbella sp. CA-293567]WBQ04747.1 ABATE domain-containing protein [Kribbella sp. CA-293567]